LWRRLWRFVAGGLSEDNMSRSKVFRIGNVTGYLRNQTSHAVGQVAIQE
jgi:hypothetical protein